jgi:hypothetical protein
MNESIDEIAARLLKFAPDGIQVYLSEGEMSRFKNQLTALIREIRRQAREAPCSHCGNHKGSDDG